MVRKNRERALSPPAARWRLDAGAFASAVLLISTVVLPLLVSVNGQDVFRLPKELAFRATAVLLALAGVFAATDDRMNWNALRAAARECAIALAIVCWCLVTTWFSTNRTLSADSLLTVAASVIIFLAARLAAPRVPVLWLGALMGAAVINAVFVIIQEARIWNPFRFPEDLEPHMKSSALIGNPNDVGAFLVVPALAAVVAAVIAQGRRRWIYAAVATLLTAGLVASGTRTALVAFVAAVILFSFMRNRRQTIVLTAFAVILIPIVIVTQTRLGQSVGVLWDAARHGRYDVLFSARVPPFLSAIDMARSHPIAGVGPGCFKFNYMNYRIALAKEYPPELLRGPGGNFAEVHNDHLQVLAETGLPGYGLFLVCVLSVAVLDVRKTANGRDAIDGFRPAFGRAIRIPLAVLFVLLTLAQFPLQLAAPRFVFLTVAGLSLGWRNHA